MKKIMIIDDDLDFLAETSDFLGANGYDVIPISQSNFVVEEAVSTMPDIIILDLKLGGISGFSIGIMLKSKKETHDIPIIAVTGFYGEDECKDIISDCNIKQCLIKPVSPRDLIMAIERV